MRKQVPNGPIQADQQSSRPRAPSSTAISAAYAVSSFVTEASSNVFLRAVLPQHVPVSGHDPNATVSTGQSRTASSAARSPTLGPCAKLGT